VSPKLQWKNDYNEKFLDLHLMGRLIRAIDELGYKEPTEIQQRTIKHAITGHNVRFEYCDRRIRWRSCDYSRKRRVCERDCIGDSVHSITMITDQQC
jgi:hypothetical protein